MSRGWGMTHFRLSRLNSVTDSNPRAFPLEVLLEEMRSGRGTVAGAIDGSPYRSLAEVTEYARQLLADGKTDVSEMIKREMPQLMPAGVFETRSDMRAVSGMVCLEFDRSGGYGLCVYEGGRMSACGRDVAVVVR